MPPLPDLPGVYVWASGSEALYVGKASTSLRRRLGPAGYASIGRSATYAARPNRRDGGQQTNCRVNALANQHLADGGHIEIWYETTDGERAGAAERAWMRTFGKPPWNLAHA